LRAKFQPGKYTITSWDYTPNTCGPDRDEAYEKAKYAAEHRPAYTGPIGLGLHFGMGTDSTMTQLADLKEHDELYFQTAFGRLAVEPMPEFAQNKLVTLAMRLEADSVATSLQYQEMVVLLSREYGTAYPHSIESSEGTSWFQDDMEVELVNIQNRYYVLTYRSLKHELLAAAQQDSIWRATGSQGQ